ncbi:penicillin-binding transpeptidase domain-containing protein [Vulgatibacter incomptus]|uniref:Cell division protein FtsI n=1 Tax=Vulgatibacter incomptus TaxID=1391653 RepID=A0A0K1PFH9_9BACT|nr:penicillin-binding transpeptidase domain-containing protein [Vulgatibacter incomptus]AKU91869.1 Cell division protein FtsI [Vulgatibacter incomptus]
MSGSRFAGAWDGARWVRVRATILAVLLGVGLCVVLGRAIHLQIVQQDKLGTLARDQYIRTVELSPHRGDILDRDGNTLASSVEVESIFVDPGLLARDPAELRDGVERVGRAAGLSREKLRALQSRSAQPGSRFVWVRRKSSPAIVAKVRALGLPGVGFVKESRRFYPQKELASQILGFVGADGHGLEGLERSLDDDLRGQGAQVAGLRDARGNALLAEAAVPMEERTGASVTLTIDRTIQYAAEKALSKAVEKANAEAGSAVVLDPSTGEVLAMVSMPTFNPNVIPGAKGRAAVRNRAVTDAFEPGSTMKVFVLAGALDRKAIRKDQSFDCEKGRWKIGKHVIHDTHPYPALTPPDILRVSSNVCSGKVAMALGNERLAQVYRDFGFGTRGGIELPGESPGLMRPFKGEIGLVTASFGQGPIMASSLQIASGYAAIANGGTRMKPWIVRSVVDPNGAVIRRGEPEVAGQAISPATAKEIARWLENVVLDGTAGKAAIDGYRVAGKTGTAQKVDASIGRYGKGRLASFAGFVPAEDPKLAIVVMIDEPKEGSVYGGQIAAPVFREIAEAALKSRGIPPSLPLLAKADEKNKTAAKGAKPEPKKPTPRDDPAEGWVSEEDAPGDGDQVLVPDVRGLFARAALRKLGDAKLGASLEGSGKVVSQRPPAGSIVERGSQVAIALEPL